MAQRSSIGSALLVIAAVAALAGCGGADTTAAPSVSSTVSATVTTTAESVAPIESAAAAPETVDAQYTEESTTRRAPVEAPDPVEFLGAWQRHASRLYLADEPIASTLSMGASCCDTEDWAVTWVPDGDGVVVTLVERTGLYGEGMFGTLYEGTSFGASPGVGSTGVPVLTTYGLGDDPGVFTWCRSGGAVPECGA